MSKKKKNGAGRNIWGLLNLTYPLYHPTWVKEQVYTSYFKTYGGYGFSFLSQGNSTSHSRERKSPSHLFFLIHASPAISSFTQMVMEG